MGQLLARIAAAIVVVIGIWALAVPAPAGAAPRAPNQEMVEYGGLTAGGAAATQKAAGSGTAASSSSKEGFDLAGVIDEVKSRPVLSISVVGVVLVLMTWKIALN